MSNQPLFMTYQMGDLDLPNRIVMAPLTRMRAQSHDHVPTALQAEYYATCFGRTDHRRGHGD